MTKNKVKTIIVSCVLAVCLVASAALFAACDKSVNIAGAYAEAEANWNAAQNKQVTDKIVINGAIAPGRYALNNVTLEGTRTYIGEEWAMDYTLNGTVKVFLGASMALPIKNGKLIIRRDAEGMISVYIKISLLGVINIDQTILTISEKEISNYLPVFDFAGAMFYDAEKISGEGEAFRINGADSLNYVLYQLAKMLSINFNFDMLPMLESWLSLGDVTGTAKFDGGNFASISTAQHLGLTVPVEDLEFLVYNIDNFADSAPMILTMLNEKVIEIPGVIKLDVKEELKDSLKLDLDISTTSTYRILGEDATLPEAA